MASYKIIEINKDGIVIEWDSVLTLNHNIPIVMLTSNPPIEAVEQAIQELYPVNTVKTVLTEQDISNASKFVGTKKTFEYIPEENILTVPSEEV